MVEIPGQVYIEPSISKGSKETRLRQKRRRVDGIVILMYIESNKTSNKKR